MREKNSGPQQSANVSNAVNTVNTANKEMFVYDVEPLDVLRPINIDESDLSSSDLESIAIIYDKIR